MSKNHIDKINKGKPLPGWRPWLGLTITLATGGQQIAAKEISR